MGCEKVRKSVLSPEPEMQTCGSKFGKNYVNWRTEGSWWKRHM